MTLVVGIGNPGRGDDGAGPAVADRVAALALPGVRVIRVAEPARLLEDWQGEEDVVVVDAVRTSAEAVTVFEVDGRSLPGGGAVSSHGMGLAEVVELARALGRLPGRLRVIGVPGHRFGHGEPLSSRAAVAVGEAVRAVQAAVAE
jgi:hydrogenase maturation protease